MVAKASLVRSSSSGLRFDQHRPDQDGAELPDRSLCGVVSPSLQDACDLVDGVLDDRLAEDPPGQRPAVEVADPVEVGEVAEQVGERGHIGADRAIDPPGPGGLELDVTGRDQMEPGLGRPGPERVLLLQAAA
jgi:hypothetical protein